MGTFHLQAAGLTRRELNTRIARCGEKDVRIEGCCGQRYIAAGLAGRSLSVYGTPGNALGCFLNGATVRVFGSCQDALGDTMNAGEIYVHGSAGDAAGYAMRGGRIFVRGDAGYRAGIHMKEYGEQVPALVIGGTAGSFVGEYQAGGIIAVLNLDERPFAADRFCAAGMHGGKIFLGGGPPEGLPPYVTARPASEEDLSALAPLLADFAAEFGLGAEALLRRTYTLVEPNTSDIYRQLYAAN